MSYGQYTICLLALTNTQCYNLLTISFILHKPHLKILQPLFFNMKDCVQLLALSNLDQSTCHFL